MEEDIRKYIRRIMQDPAFNVHAEVVPLKDIIFCGAAETTSAVQQQLECIKNELYIITGVVPEMDKLVYNADSFSVSFTMTNLISLVMLADLIDMGWHGFLNLQF